MSNDTVQHQHNHKHSIACGHTKIKHEEHIDYVHDGHLHHGEDGKWVECKIPVSDLNPNEHNPISCACNHTDDCGHELVPHGDHYDYLVNGRLHHVHDSHCDDHGPVEIVMILGAN